MSHAGLLKLYIEEAYPDADTSHTPLTIEEVEERKTHKKGQRKARNNENNNKQEKLF